MYQFVETRAAKTSASAVQMMQGNRAKTARGILDFEYNKKRNRVLSSAKEIKQRAAGIVYWISRNQRVEDNWALLYAQALGLRNSLPLHVVFCLTDRFLEATLRQFKFMIDGLKEVQSDCTNLNINFHLLRGEAGEQVSKFVKNHNMGAVVCDFSPLRIHRGWVESLQKKLAADVPFVQVDA